MAALFNVTLNTLKLLYMTSNKIIIIIIIIIIMSMMMIIITIINLTSIFNTRISFKR